MEEMGEFNKTVTDKRMAWKIVIQPRPTTSAVGLTGETNSLSSTDIQITREIYRWEKITENVGGNIIEYWSRIANEEVPMKFEHSDGVSVANGCLNFDGNNSFLKITDPGLSHDVFQIWGYEIKKPVLSEAVRRSNVEPDYVTPIVIYGKNIQIEAEVGITAADGIYPIFFFEQPNNENVCLSVRKTGKYCRVQWSISGQQYETYPYTLDGNYLLTVSQDRDRTPGEDEPTYFEFFVDTIPLRVADQKVGSRVPGFTKKKHTFKNDAMEWYVGYNPITKASFQGTIRRIVFDPNASCPECP